METPETPMPADPLERDQQRTNLLREFQAGGFATYRAFQFSDVERELIVTALLKSLGERT